MLTYGFFNSSNGDRKYTAEQMSDIFDQLLTEGVLETYGNKYFTIPQTSGLGVIVRTGWAWFDQTWTKLDADQPFQIDVPDLSLSRIDTVAIVTNKSELTRANSIQILKGTPSVVPTPVVVENTATVHTHPIAYVTVRPEATQITAADIEILVGKAACPFITSILQATDITTLFAAWEQEFNEWFENIQQVLSEEVVTNLQLQIDQLKTNKVNVSDKATTAEAQAGTNDTKWMTPAKVKSAVEEQLRIPRIAGGVLPYTSPEVFGVVYRALSRYQWCGEGGEGLFTRIGNNFVMLQGGQISTSEQPNLYYLDMATKSAGRITVPLSISQTSSYGNYAYFEKISTTYQHPALDDYFIVHIRGYKDARAVYKNIQGFKQLSSSPSILCGSKNGVYVAGYTMNNSGKNINMVYYDKSTGNYISSHDRTLSGTDYVTVHSIDDTGGILLISQNTSTPSVYWNPKTDVFTNISGYTAVNEGSSAGAVLFNNGVWYHIFAHYNSTTLIVDVYRMFQGSYTMSIYKSFSFPNVSPQGRNNSVVLLIDFESGNAAVYNNIDYIVFINIYDSSTNIIAPTYSINVGTSTFMTVRPSKDCRYIVFDGYMYDLRKSQLTLYRIINFRLGSVVGFDNKIIILGSDTARSPSYMIPYNTIQTYIPLEIDLE